MPDDLSELNDSVIEAIYDQKESNMAPGDRAIDMMVAAYEEKRIEDRIDAGEEPIEAMVAIWGAEGLRSRIRESRFSLPKKLLCMSALETYEARKAAWLAQEGPCGYRDAPRAPVPVERTRGFLVRIWTRFVKAFAGTRS